MAVLLLLIIMLVLVEVAIFVSALPTYTSALKVVGAIAALLMFLIAIGVLRL